MKRVCGQKVCAIVVTWNIKNRYVANFKAIVLQVARVIIVDNGSGPETLLMLESLQSCYPDRLKVIYNKENKGIGAAQNQGVDIALQSGYEWILLLDHDSFPAPDMVAQLLAAYDAMADHDIACRKKTGLMAPNKKEQHFAGEMKLIQPKGMRFWRKFGNDRIVPEVRSVVASGSLIKKDVFRDIGRFNAAFFMDYVDVEFCLRMHQKGWRIAAVRDAVLYHNLGNITGRKIMGHDVSVSNHDAGRRFTMFRNRMVIWKNYFFLQPGYILFDMVMAAYELAKICRYESGARQKLTAAFRGLVAGTAGSVGQAEP